MLILSAVCMHMSITACMCVLSAVCMYMSITVCMCLWIYTRISHINTTL